MITIQRAESSSGEVINHKLAHVDREASVLEASKLMRKAGATELLVTVEADGILWPFGILTAKDIVTRVLATGLDPAVLTTGDIASPVLADADADNVAAEGPRRSGRGVVLG